MKKMFEKIICTFMICFTYIIMNFGNLVISSGFIVYIIVVLIKDTILRKRSMFEIIWNFKMDFKDIIISFVNYTKIFFNDCLIKMFV